jgi:ubiquinone/menaquinone biosynthesis C-methylase UbiE
MARSYQRADWKFMNYGYAPLKDQENGLVLDQADEVNRQYIQLYDHVAGAVNLHDLDVLEVGCGRGGGAEYITRYLKPEKMVGVDLSANVISLCNNIYDLEGLSFQTGNAESLPFPDQSIDILINVESSHCYGSVENFFSEVKRVLRVGGHFLLADFRTREKADLLRDSLQKSGLSLIKETDITENILEALYLDHDLKTWFIQETIHKPLTWLFHQFAGTPGTAIYNRFENRESIYLSFILQK